MTDRRRVLVTSGDRLFGEAVAAALGEAGAETAYAADALAAMAAIARRVPDAVVVVGDDLPRLATAPFTRQVRQRWPSVTVVVVGGRAAADAVVLSADSAVEDVVAAVASAPGEAAPETSPEDGAFGSGVALLAGLTQRQRVVLRLLVEGGDMRSIGRELGLSEHTVRTHMQNLYARLGCHSRLELVRFATEHGLLGAPAEPPSG